MGKISKEEEQILLKVAKDRRILPNVPYQDGTRRNQDRRGNSALNNHMHYSSRLTEIKQRYQAVYEVKVRCYHKGKVPKELTCSSVDVSTTGILLETKSKDDFDTIVNADTLKLQFEIQPGTMPEGYECKIDCNAHVTRVNADTLECGVAYEESLISQLRKKKDRYMYTASAILLILISAFVIFMRAESVIYFNFNKILYLYSIITAVFLLTRYLFGLCYKPISVDPDFTPGVTIIIPCFNEEEWIDRTILSCINQDYPIHKLEVLVIDDCSNDRSVEVIKDTIDTIESECKEEYDIKNRLSYYIQPENKGKRDALAVGALRANHELVVFVDSDSFLDPYAVRNLVQPFRDPKMGGVTGRTDVANTYTNWLTKMQAVRYYIAFRVMKAAESYFDTVTCLSGPISCYRKELVLKYLDPWLNQKFLGQPATFGDDRSLTNFILRKNRTYYQDTAICSTIVPHEQKVFLKQQMRWKRSWLRESMIAGSFIWKKEPFMAIFFYVGLIVPILSPIVVVYNMLYVPIVYMVFPLTFIIGFFLMAFLMSFAQMLFRKSSIWLYGVVFCVYYLCVLLWQMPVAWVTFWKSTWGTRMTPQDIEANKKKEERKQRRQSEKTRV